MLCSRATPPGGGSGVAIATAGGIMRKVSRTVRVPGLACGAAVVVLAAAGSHAAAQSSPDPNTTSRACAPGTLHPDAPPETRQFD